METRLTIIGQLKAMENQAFHNENRYRTLNAQLLEYAEDLEWALREIWKEVVARGCMPSDPREVARLIVDEFVEMQDG